MARVRREAKAYSNLMQYFSNYPNGQLPEREFMFSILSTIHADRLRDLVLEAKMHRSTTNLELYEETTHIIKFHERD